jgi:hypothetical protein
MRYLILLLISLVIISGCFPTSNQNDKNVVSEVNSQSGRLTNRGVTLKFIDGSPSQDRIRSEFPFSVRVLLENWASKPTSGDIYLSDKFTGSLSAIQGKVQQRFDLEGLDKGIRPTPKGKEIDLGSYTYPPSPSLTGTTIRAELEYEYNVEFFTDICVKSRNAKVNEQECTSRRSFSSNDLGFDAQHAPVTVTNIKQELDSLDESTAEIFLTLTFEDFGGSDGWINNEENSLDIDGRIILKGKGPFSCSPNILRFRESRKKVEVDCFKQVSLDGQNFFSNPLEISLSYPYKSIVTTKEIPIKHRKEISTQILN